MALRQPPHYVLEANVRRYTAALKKGEWFQAHQVLATGIVWNENNPRGTTVDVLQKSIANSPTGPISDAWFKLLLETHDAINMPLQSEEAERLFLGAVYNNRFDIADVLVAKGLDVAETQRRFHAGMTYDEYEIRQEVRLLRYMQIQRNAQLEAQLQEAKAEITELRATVEKLSAPVARVVAAAKSPRCDMSV